MNIQCRPTKVSDFGVVECAHWESPDHVGAYLEKQGIASMLAYDGPRYLGQLYLKEYDPQFAELGGWTGNRCWADFRIAEPLGLAGRFLTIGCYHVGWMPDDSRDSSLYGRGIGTGLLKAVIEWCRKQDAIDGLLSWGLVAGSHALLSWAGQMPHTVYQRHGFREIKRVSDPRMDEALAKFKINTTGTAEDRAILRVMLLSRDKQPD